MRIKLKILDIKNLQYMLNRSKSEEFPISIQYADFNVLNHLYEGTYDENKLNNLVLYPDSSAVHIYMNYFLKNKIKKTISTDLQNSLLNEINENGNSIFLLGDSNFILKKTIKNINNKYTNINIKGFSNGYNFITNEVITKINELNIDVLFVGLGVGQQEKWLLENYKKLNVKIVMNVGGWFQYLSENKKRAPLFIRKIHLEWLHKLIIEFPRVWKRYIVGIPKFYIRVITKKIELNLEYK
ncbi:MAG: hypothetical protein COW71_08250 [Ignavibacteriales bacterium CG18_big_fil_WC_8_21_14_2_50_31_20]|nr:MAG: hypothetical protein COW71_08250 [Ignavibacteriales bacterium CG18_big_fil_WC_8_21_14_2_50_31_20]